MHLCEECCQAQSQEDHTLYLNICHTFCTTGACYYMAAEADRIENVNPSFESLEVNGFVISHESNQISGVIKIKPIGHKTVVTPDGLTHYICAFRHQHDALE